jgi:hypothetical protein
LVPYGVSPQDTFDGRYPVLRGAVRKPRSSLQAPSWLDEGEKKDLAGSGKGLACNGQIAGRAGNAKDRSRSVMTTMP